MLLYPQKMIHPGVLNPLDCEQFLSFPQNQPRKHKNRAAKWRNEEARDCDFYVSSIYSEDKKETARSL